MSDVLIAGAVGVVVWLVLTLLLWWLVPIAFGLALGFWQAGAMALLAMVFGGGIFFLEH